MCQTPECTRESKKLQEKVQKLTDEYVKKVDAAVSEKSAEIMKV